MLIVPGFTRYWTCWGNP